MPVKTPKRPVLTPKKPGLTHRERAIFKKTTSVNGRLVLGVARDAKTGKLVKIDN